MSSDAKHSKTDLLIIGAGPAGLMAANFAVACGLKNVRIIDRRSDKVFVGQADGLQSRTLEVLESFAMRDEIARAAQVFEEIADWNPVDGKLVRTSTAPGTKLGLSRYRSVVLHQGHIEQSFLKNIDRLSDGAIKVERALLPEKLSWDEERFEDTSQDNYPVTVQVRQLSEEEATPSQNGKSIRNGLYRSSLAGDDNPANGGSEATPGAREIIHAKYVIGCDGAHSWTRKQIRGQMEGEQTEHIWGVLDAVPITDFPDIRKTCRIRSEKSGSILVIPRENGLVRLYIELSATHKGLDRHKVDWQMIVASAQAILAPYRLEIREQDLDWWTAYVIGQRVSDTFTMGERIFVAGDACHTHSPKAGQGMNVSMMDTYNLAWKLAAVIKNQSPRSILSTYQSERRPVAVNLINFDRAWARMFSEGPSESGPPGANGFSSLKMEDALAKAALQTAGLAVQYSRSLVCGATGDDEQEPNAVTAPGAISRQELSATEAEEWSITVGRRFRSAQVVNQADATAVHLADLMPSDGRWRIVLFCGDIREEKQKRKVETLAEHLGKLQARFTAPDADVDSVIDVLTVSSTPRAAAELTSYPAALRALTTR